MARQRVNQSSQSGKWRSIPARVPALSAFLAASVTASLAILGLPAAGPAAAATCLEVPPGVEAWWPGEGTADEVIHGRDGIVQGATFAGGKVGQSFSFDGIDDEVTVADDPVWTLGTRDFSQSMWVKMQSTGRAVFTSHDEGVSSPYPKWMFHLDAGVLYFDVNWPYNGQSMVSADWVPEVGTWYHVAVTREADNWTLYVDGTPIGSAVRAATLPEIEAPVRLGYAESNENGIYSLDGKLDEVAFFHRALSAAEVAGIYTADVSGLCAPVAADLTMTASRTSMLTGEPVTLSGALSLGAELSVSGRDIVIYRAVNDRPAVVMATKKTTTDGAYTFTDKPPQGSIHYSAWFEGADNAVPAVARKTVSVSRGVSKVTLSASDKNVKIGQSITLTAHLTGGATNRSVVIYANPARDTKRSIARGEVSPAGIFKTRVTPRVITNYTAYYAGDISWKSDTSEPVRVAVRARWKVKDIGFYGRSGRYHLYHYNQSCVSDGHGCPATEYQLVPDHGRASVKGTLQWWRNGSWHQDTQTFRLFERSKIYIYYHYGDSRLIGQRFRWRMDWSGDATHIGSTSRWSYWKVTR